MGWLQTRLGKALLAALAIVVLWQFNHYLIQSRRIEQYLVISFFGVCTWISYHYAVPYYSGFRGFGLFFTLIYAGIRLTKRPAALYYAIFVQEVILDRLALPLFDYTLSSIQRCFSHSFVTLPPSK